MNFPNGSEPTVLTDGKDIAIWIFEPRNFVTRRSCPDSELAILHEGILFQDNASVPEPSDDGFDIFYFPAQNRALQWSEIWDFCNPNLMPSDAHDQCVLIEAYKLTSEVSSIEGTRLVVILGGNKANHLSRSEHLFPPCSKSVCSRWTDAAQETWCLTGLCCL